MPRKTRRRIRRKRVRGTRRVRTYYRGGNRRYNGEGGYTIRELYEKISNNITNSSTYQNITNSPTYKNISSGADNIVRGIVGLKTNNS
jgi:hypothetical protein